ncbi:uncharacterized protein V2V93DRAFT_371592 [Kockiozyma suomiensis]|uniref:uncharacterized protein n=1 Tax=Kockiozyma suomiensis TaxID=1337062 RepID=UPI0033435155
MGSSQSKSSPRTFLPQTPVQFSQDLVEVLQNVPESDFSRATEHSLKIESDVSTELTKIQQEAASILSQAWSKTESAPAPSSSSLTSEESLANISKLKEHLQARLQKIEKKAVDGAKAGFEKPREELIKCLSNNTTKPLMCLDEFNAFKDKLESTIN